jgi:ribosome-associated translation inhibitor RaiA
MYPDDSQSLRIQLETKGCDLSEGEIIEMEEDLHTLRQVVKDFPVSDLHITVIHHARRNDYHVKTSLGLPGRTLFTGERAHQVHPAYEQCIRKLVGKVRAYKDRMRGDIESSKQAEGTRRTVTPTQHVEMENLEKAVRKDDYAAFRLAVDSFEAGLTHRIGRWVQRYPAIESQLGARITISDIVEDVFVRAFQQFPVRPKQIQLGDWIERLIDPCIQAFIESPEEEFANISFARHASEAPDVNSSGSS